MGAMYADHFSRNGFRTLLLATGERADRLRQEPVTVNGVSLDVEIVDPLEPPRTPSRADLVIVAVKHGHLAEAVSLMAPLITQRSTILSVLNGLDSEQLIVRGLREAGVPLTEEQVPLCIALAMDAERSGQEVRYTQSGRLVFGPAGAAGDASEPHLAAAHEALAGAGLESSTPRDMRHQMWWKFMVNVGINQPSAVLRLGYGGFRDPGPAHDLMMALIEEVRAVAAAEGVTLSDADVERWRTVLAGQPADGMTSMHQDVLAGRATEVDIFAGHVVELGRRHGVEVPHNQSMLWILHALAG